MYVCSEQLFYRIHEEDPKAGNALTASKLMIQLHLTEPDGVVVLNGRSKPMRFHFGTNSEKPDLTVTLTADTLHQILLGELGLRQAMSAKLITVDGPVIKARRCWLRSSNTASKSTSNFKLNKDWLRKSR
ncbi:MAG: SCP2 sterol-binding domain-containing protein [Chloroflexota bacterium]